MATLQDKAAAFVALHASSAPFVIANAWDAGSARMLAGMGFPAIATSSGASAKSMGKADGQLTRDEVLAHLRAVVGACDVPVSADLENGFGDDPTEVAESFRLAAETGIVGGSVEDGLRGEGGVYELELAAERVAAAREATRGLPYRFVLTARCENFLRECMDLDDTIRRLQAYERMGADVLFAPGLRTLDQVKAVCESVGVPVNFMVGIPGASFSVEELAQAGVKRISVATSLYSVAMRAAKAAAQEILDSGSFTYIGTR